MMCTYLKVLVPGQRHESCLTLGDHLSQDGPVVRDDGLDACLIVHVHDELLVASGSNRLRPGLVPQLASVEILRTNKMYSFII